jgi:thioredoxin-like negative regulator of GroEL
MAKAMYHSPDVLILIGTHCPHCPSVLAALADMVKQGEVGKLEVVNIEARPETAAALGVRSVPWIRMGNFTLTGLHSKGELQAWAKKAGSVEGTAEYLVELLSSGQVSDAVAYVKQHPESIEALLQLLGDAQQKINVKVGLGVIFEELEGSEMLRTAVDALGKLINNPSVEVRADACHYLGLTHAEKAKPLLEQCLLDDDEAVREIAGDSLEVLAEA